MYEHMKKFIHIDKIERDYSALPGGGTTTPL